MTRRVKRGWMNLRVTKIIEDNHNTKTFKLVDAEEGGRQFDYTSGQYLTFRFDSVAEKPQVRSYTMSSAPNELEDIAFTVKAVDDGFISKYLVEDVKEGDILRARGPIGKFCYNSETDAKHLMMVAAGSGVTPFVSMLKEHAPHLGEEGHPERMTLLVTYRSTQDLICWDDLQRVSKIHGINVHVSLSREETEGFWHGRVSPELIDRAAQSSYTDTTFMTCGPDAMMEQFVTHLKMQGVDEDQIKMESFA